MEPNKTIKLELTPFEARQLKAMDSSLDDINVATFVLALMISLLVALTIIKIIEGNIILGIIGILLSAISLHAIIFSKTSLYKQRIALHKINRKL